MSTYKEEKELDSIQKLRSYLVVMPGFMATYFRGIEARTNPLSRLGYANDLKLFFEWLLESNPALKSKEMSDISIEDLGRLKVFDFEEYLDYLKTYKDSKGNEHIAQNETIRRKTAAVRSLFRYLYKNELISANPTERLDLPRLNEKAIIRLDIDEVAKFLDLVESGSETASERKKKFHENVVTRDLAIMSLFLGTGLRVSELVGINRMDLDLEQTCVYVKRKEGKEAYVYFSDEVAEALANYLDERNLIEVPEYTISETGARKSNDTDALFLSNRKTRITVRSVERLVKEYARQIAPNKHITPHGLRRTFGTHLYEETRDINVTAEFLGHKDIAVTKSHYVMTSEEVMRQHRNTVKLREP